MRRHCSTLARLSAPVLFVLSATAQGTFVNFETPQVKPIAIARVGGTEFLLVCNTPDDSVELYDPNTASPSTAPTFIDRVPVGQGPASVRFDPTTSCFFTANYIGDSVTKIQLTNTGGTLTWALVATKPVGEAPADLALSGDGALFVTLADGGRLATLSAATLELLNPLVPPELMTQSQTSPTMAVKEPRRIEVLGGAPWVLNMKGGNTHSPHLGSPMYDLDVWTHDPATSTPRIASGLGTTNAGMAFGPDGLLYVVGSMARNEVAHEANLRALAVTGTGFVESRLWVVDPALPTPAVIASRDLNRTAGGGIQIQPNTCSQPMDIVLKTDGSLVTKAYIATFGSDRLVVLENTGGSASTWARSLILLAMTPQPNNYSRTGPRGLAMNRAQTRLYCLNQLSNSVSVVNLTSDTEAVRFPLQRDMTPRGVRAGRRFLYSAEFSGNGTVACSSCHVDARTDALGWNLGAPGLGSVPHPAGLDDLDTPPDAFPDDKGIMVTQSLQGLVNHPLNVAGQDFFTNKPYHWRGDRADFTAFNPAFDVLMGGNQLAPEDMTVYRDFINTVMYTPNPEQAPDRVLRGTLGDVDDSQTGTGALRGLKVFATDAQERCGGRSCTQCHWMPEGSNNRITESGGGIGGLETAALRSLFGREGRAEAPAAADQPGTSNIMTTHFGLSHDGHDHAATALQPLIVNGPASIDRFVFDSFNIVAAQLARFEDLVQFVREWDTGIAPSVGVTYMVTFGNKSAPATTTAFDLLEGQVKKANCGLAVHARIGNQKRGYYFDITGASDVYQGPTGPLTRSQLLASLTMLASGDLLVLQGTPAGSERRIAALDGNPGVLAGGAPQNILLQPMRPPTQWTDVPLLTKNWDPLHPQHPFDFTLMGVGEPLSIKSVRLLQRAILQFDMGLNLGLPHLRHEAARRFAVAGTNIRLGAKLQLRIPAPVTANVPPPYAEVDVLANTILIETGLYPTDQTIGELRVWETTLVADPLLLYTLLLGGPSAPGVAACLNDPGPIPETMPGTFDPTNWNKFHVTVVNENAMASTPSWQVLKIQ